jgi:hypothetical protein
LLLRLSKKLSPGFSIDLVLGVFKANLSMIWLVTTSFFALSSYDRWVGRLKNLVIKFELASLGAVFLS